MEKGEKGQVHVVLPKVNTISMSQTLKSHVAAATTTYVNCLISGETGKPTHANQNGINYTANEPDRVHIHTFGVQS